MGESRQLQYEQTLAQPKPFARQLTMMVKFWLGSVTWRLPVGPRMT